MTWTPCAFAVAAALYTGFQWTIRLLVYPQFAQVPADAFVAYELRHQRLTSITVGPLFVAQTAASVLLFVAPPSSVSRWWAVAAGSCVIIIVALTATLAVPLHGVLARGWDPGTYRRLLRVDTARLVVSKVATGLGGMLTLR